MSISLWCISAFSAGWRIKDEAFMEDADEWLSPRAPIRLLFRIGTNGSVQKD